MVFLIAATHDIELVTKDKDFGLQYRRDRNGHYGDPRLG